MKREYFSGVAVHPARVVPGQTTMVGVWVKQKFSRQQRQEIVQLNKRIGLGHFGVRVGDAGTAVMFLGCSINDTKTARKLASFLVQVVRTVVGCTAILRQLRNYSEVSRALAG